MTTERLSDEEIKAKIKVVCICKGIKQGKICEAINEKKLSTKEEVNQKTGAGSGGCKGIRCGPVIEKILENKGKPIATPHPYLDKKEDL